MKSEQEIRELLDAVKAREQRMEDAGYTEERMQDMQARLALEWVLDDDG